MLEGISMPVCLQNVQVISDFETLYEVDKAGEGEEHRSGRKHSVGFCGKVAQQDFNLEVDETSKLIASLHEQHHDFFPGEEGHGKHGHHGGHNAKRDRAVTEGDEEEGATAEERLAERLEYFKMNKRFDEPLPPLTPAGVSSKHVLMQMTNALPKPEVPEIIEYNMSEEAVGAWQPKERKERSLQKKDHVNHHRVEVRANGDLQVKLFQNKWAEDILQKRIQADLCVANVGKKKKVCRKETMQVEEPDEQWLTICALTLFMQTAHIKLHAHKKALGTDQDNASDTLATLAANPSTERTFTLMAAMWRNKSRRKAKRAACDVLHDCALNWRRGILLTRLQAYIKNVRKLQTWWRETSKSLHEIRDHISKRWDVLERADLTHQHAVGITLAHIPHLSASAGPSKTKGRRLAHSATTYMMEDSHAVHLNPTDRKDKRMHHAASSVFFDDSQHYVESHLVSEAKRLQFIEHELRARRYFLLPQVMMYQEEHDKWKLAEEERRGSTDKRTLAAFFRMPPLRPSYLPTDHIGGADRHGTPCEICSKWCHGETGDQEIMRWRDRCKKSEFGRGWTVIPKVTNVLRRHRSTASSSSSAADGGDNATAAAAQQSLFGHVADQEEMRKWGADLGHLDRPGLDVQGDNDDLLPIVNAHGV